MRIIVAGSPHWDGTETRYRVTDLLRAFQEVSMLLGEPLTVVHRDHPVGVDHIVDRWSRLNGVTQDIFPVKRFHYGTAAEDVRDRLMVEAGADMVIVFAMPDDDPDSDDLLNWAKAYNVASRIIRWDEDWPIMDFLARAPKPTGETP